MSPNLHIRQQRPKQVVCQHPKNTLIYFNEKMFEDKVFVGLVQ